MRALLATIFCAFFAVSAAAAEWRLNPELSHLSFGSVKKGDVGEVHHFTGLEGGITADGMARIEIDLASVETWADIRNERMRDFLFETARYPVAVLTARIDGDGLKDAAPGSINTVSVATTLSLHGVEQPLKTDLIVARVAPDRVMVVPAELVMIDAEAFGLSDGIRKLAELAALPAISAAVPVSFHFIFDRVEE